MKENRKENFIDLDNIVIEEKKVLNNNNSNNRNDTDFEIEQLSIISFLFCF